MPLEETTKKKSKESWSFLPDFVDRMFLSVEDFAGRLLNLLADTAEGVVARVIQRLYGLLLLGVGIVFVLIGAAKMLNTFFRYDGLGECIVGAFLLFVTSLVIMVAKQK